MSENETTDVKPAAATPAAVKKDKKKDKRPSETAENLPHVTGRLLRFDVGTNGVEFSIRGKRDKTEVFSLKGMDATTMTAAAALMAGLLNSKTKLRVEYSTSGDSKLVSKIRAHL